ncbi:MAG: hypothetical protein M3R27_16930 [Bacteroidota bacterium]|nr:hypothetical protein [Bacteroidota bacterium]
MQLNFLFMLKSAFTATVFLFLLFTTSAFSQAGKDTILLLNGNVVITNVIDTTDGITNFKDPKNEKKNFTIENDRIFSITDSAGEHIMYVYDTILGNEFTIDEMRYFIRGEQDAEKGFKANGALITGMIIGAASGVTGSILCPIPPFGFAILAGLPKVKIKANTVTNKEDLKQDTYLMGYERVARKKRKLKSLIGGGIGLGIGLGTFFILQSTGKELIQ